jgi:flagellar motility protein MotE (MotC chaperone)
MASTNGQSGDSKIMNIKQLFQVVLLSAAVFTATAQAQPYNRDYQRDLRKRDQLERRVAADQRAVDKERRELRHSNFFERGHERRELSNAERRLDRDLAELRALDAHLNAPGRR